MSKSTLTINLANHFNTNYIDEAGRDISEQSGTDLLMLPEDFTEILLTHKMNEIKAAFVQDGDRSPVIENDRQTYSNRIKEIFQAHGKQFISISGTYQERYEKAVALVNALLEDESDEKGMIRM